MMTMTLNTRQSERLVDATQELRLWSVVFCTYTVGAVDATGCGLIGDAPDMVTQLEAVVWMH